jgi:hypothetical protein
MADKPSPPWILKCPWCAFRILVNARGQSGGDPGSGVEAAGLMTAHVEDDHGRTWEEFLQADPPTEALR